MSGIDPAVYSSVFTGFEYTKIGRPSREREQPPDFCVCKQYSESAFAERTADVKSLGSLPMCSNRYRPHP